MALVGLSAIPTQINLGPGYCFFPNDNKENVKKCAKAFEILTDEWKKTKLVIMGKYILAIA